MAHLKGASSAFIVGALVSGSVNAAQIDIGNPEVKINWDNTVKYSTMYRLNDASDKLVSSVNQDDGDRNFDKGIVSNRFDLLSEFDLTYQNFGVRLSGAAWYDSIYNQSNDNDSPETANQVSVDYDHFTHDTRDLHGRKAELLDSFVFGKFHLGSTTATFRAGRHTVLWGETLFFGANGIAGGQAPVDLIKAQSVPNTPFKELIRPVQQFSGQLQLTPDVSIGAYYQWRWEQNRFPAVGSYFSSSDVYDAGAETLKFFGPFAATKGDTIKAKDSGQGGLQLKIRGDETDYGIYLIRYHDKSPQMYTRGSLPGTPAGVELPAEFVWVYPENITAFGASFSHTVGLFNLAGEASVRHNMPLASDGQQDDFGADNDDHPLYAVGKTAHANFSWIATLPPNFLSQETSWSGELAWNRTMSITKNREALNPNADRDAWNFRTVFEPTYRQTFPGVDLSVPVGIGFGIGNSSAVGNAFNGDHVGDLSIGLDATYLDETRFSLSYTHYFGPEGTYLDDASHISFKQSLKDRDFISLSVRRTF